MAEVLTHNQTFDSPQAALAHYGVKGMKWGVRKEDDKSSSAPSKSDPELADKAARLDAFGADMQRQLDAAGVSSESLNAKYGSTEVKSGLSRNQKLAIAGVGIGAVVAGGLAYYSIQNRANTREALLAQKVDILRRTDRMLIVKDGQGGGADGVSMHWDKGVDLPAGQIFPRVSSVQETEVRPDGFFSAFRPDDVSKYKAVLPTYWEAWGTGRAEDGGWISNYRAKAPVKAPSGKDTMSIFKRLMNEDDGFRTSVTTAKKDELSSFTDSEWRSYLGFHSQSWKDSSDPATQTFFAATKAAGYNALIDFNDAGALSHSPMRLIDGSNYEIVGHDRLSIDEMLAAAEQVRASLVHALNMAKNFLAHNGFGRKTRKEVKHGSS